MQSALALSDSVTSGYTDYGQSFFDNQPSVLFTLSAYPPFKKTLE